MSHRLARSMRPGCACRTGLRVLSQTPDIPAGSPQEMPRLYLAAGQCGTRVLRETARPGWGSDERSLAVLGRTLAITRAEKVACTPGDQRCLPLPYDVEGALATCTPKGRCKVGWIVANAGRDA